MHDDVGKVNQNPALGIQSFDPKGANLLIAQFVANSFGDCSDMTTVGTIADDKVVGIRTDFGQLQTNDIFGFTGLGGADDSERQFAGFDGGLLQGAGRGAASERGVDSCGMRNEVSTT